MKAIEQKDFHDIKLDPTNMGGVLLSQGSFRTFNFEECIVIEPENLEAVANELLRIAKENKK